MDIIILGAGGHASVLIDSLHSQNCKVIGVVDPALHQQTSYAGIPVLGDDEAVWHYSPEQVVLVNALGIVPKQNNREALYEKFLTRGYRFTDVIHRSAVLADTVQLTADVQVMAGVILQPNVHIASHTIINTRASIDHGCLIGRHVHVAPGVVMCADVTIDDYCYIGPGATITRGVHIAKHAIIGAGAIVVKNVPAYAKVLPGVARIESCVAN